MAKKGIIPKNFKECQEKAWESNKGRKHTKEAKRKMRENHKEGISPTKGKTKNNGMYPKQCGFQKGNQINLGIKHPNWQGGISYEPYDPNFNRKFKNSIRKRDNQICMLCNIHREKLNRALDVHHVNYDKLLSILENCISLCHSCHMKTNFNRKQWITFFQTLLSEKYGYNYNNEQIVIKLQGDFKHDR